MCLYVYNTVDIVEDGKSVESQSIIYLDLIKQLTTHCNEYVEVFGTEKQFNDIMEALYIAQGGKTYKKKWMVIPK